MNEMQFPVCAPCVKEHMLKPKYWIEQVEDAEGLILNKEEINDLNEKTFKQMGSKGLEETLYDLEKFPLIITKEKLLNTMKAYSSKEIFPTEHQYDASANEISNKLLGERYGWGGMFGKRDCSQFVMDIYRTMGIIIPRDDSMQEEGAAGKYIKFIGTIKDRENILNRLKAGDPVYMKGHAVMYLGRVRNNYYVIHSGAGYGMRNKDGSTRPITVHGVFVMELHQLLMSGKKTYLERFTTARKFQ